ncbi:MAG: UbiX family flavin prenyltransferase [Proteobacteria bacterium]|nr:UbiX family flavin prenyltransferase [Pseudomonadota bacterium]
MKRLIIAMTGASGAIYGIRALQALQAVEEIETHLVISSSAQYTIAAETDMAVDDINALADQVHNYKDIGASLSSGSYPTLGMLIAPCSVKTLSGIANCYDDNLIVRAADVCLKERRKVVALLRETPLHLGHIKIMEQATLNGVIVMPPVPAFYHRPTTIDGIINQTVGRALDLFDLDVNLVERWKQEPPSA